jgi:predicted Zn-dependent peptidase
LEAIINDSKLSVMNQLESNNARTNRMVTSFINDSELDQIAMKTERMSKIQKEELVTFVKRHYGDNYVEIYKTLGERESNKVEKPEITPVKVNRDAQSPFVKSIIEKEVDLIEPKFVDFEKDLQKVTIKDGLPMYYVENTENETFLMSIRWDIGTAHSKLLGLAGNFFSYLGTEKNSNTDLQKKFFEIGISYNINVGEKTTAIYLSGLTDNMERGMVLLEDLIKNAVPDQAVLDNLVQDVLKSRENELTDRNTILQGALYEYAKYGKDSKFLNVLSKEELLNLYAMKVVKTLKDLMSYEHEIFFYGNKNIEDVKRLISLHHQVNRGLINPTSANSKKLVDITENQILFVHYEMEQSEFMMLSKGDEFDATRTPMTKLYNNYFGGGMGGIVFQEIRESKALAYSTYSALRSPYRADEPYYTLTYIGTQADKLKDAIDGIQLILNDLPRAEKNLSIAQQSIEQKMRTERINKEGIYFAFKSAQRLNLTRDPRKAVFENVPQYEMTDVVDFHKKYIANKPYTMIMIGNKEKVDLGMLKNYGNVKVLELKDVFAY